LKAHFLNGIIPLHLPSLRHIEDGVEIVVGVGCRAEEPTIIAAVAHYDFVDDVFQPGATRPDHRQERHPVSKALLNEII
jgi:hypothetical protein